MRQIGTIAEEADATRFGSFLLTLGIDNSVEESTGGWAVWVENDDLLDRARAELEKFQASPTEAAYDQAVQAARLLELQRQKEEQRRRKNFIDVRTRIGQPRQWTAPLTFALILFTVVVGMASRVWETRPTAGEPPIVNVLRIAPVEVVGPYITWGGLRAVKHGQVWRLITPIFLHGGILHLVFNMFWLLDLGAMIETRRSTIYLAILVLVSAILSNLAQYWWNGPYFGGMSGVVYALFGYVWIRGRIDPTAGIAISQQSATIMLMWLVACMIGFIPHVANAAHVGGIVVGILFAYVPHLYRTVRR